MANGKPKKVALVACMRKRLNYLTSLLSRRKNQPRRRSEMRRGPGQSPGCLIAKKVLIFKTVALFWSDDNENDLRSHVDSLTQVLV